MVPTFPHCVSSSSFLKVGLCFSGFFFFSTTTFPAGGVPTRSRASSFTAVTARKRFGFLFRAMPTQTVHDFDGRILPEE